MAKLAIKGHPTRGEEVIEILKMLGGCNDNLCSGTFINSVYFINDYGYIEGDYSIHKLDYLQLTLEEFLEKFPYKIGDKILYKTYGIYSKIKTLLWNAEKERVFYRLESNKLFVAIADELQPRKEDAMDKAIKAVFDAKVQCCDIMNDIIKKDMEEELIPRVNFDKYCKDKYLLDLGNYEIKEENGKTYAVRKQFEYPKTYKECCKELGHPEALLVDRILGYKGTLLSIFQELLVCRDAYWRIAGEQMGLGKPWEPELNSKKHKFALSNVGGNISFEVYGEYNSVLCFPTEEMRDAFFENFKDLIEECKELL